jgi:hypothetical protein
MHLRVIPKPSQVPHSLEQTLDDVKTAPFNSTSTPMEDDRRIDLFTSMGQTNKPYVTNVPSLVRGNSFPGAGLGVDMTGVDAADPCRGKRLPDDTGSRKDRKRSRSDFE